MISKNIKEKRATKINQNSNCDPKERFIIDITILNSFEIEIKKYKNINKQKDCFDPNWDSIKFTKWKYKVIDNLKSEKQSWDNDYCNSKFPIRYFFPYYWSKKNILQKSIRITE